MKAESQLKPDERGRAREAIRKARIAVNNAARAFDKGRYRASVSSCQEATGRLETAVANMEESDMKWEQITKCTEDPKLAWLESRLDEAGIANRREGETRNAPILEVDASKLDEARDIPSPVDDIPDDDERFV